MRFQTSALKAESGRNNPLQYLGLEPESVSRLAFQCDALPAELSPELWLEGRQSLSLELGPEGRKSLSLEL